MLIKRLPDTQEKLQALARMATDDILEESPRAGAVPADIRSVHRSAASTGSGPYQGGMTPHTAVYRASMPGGRRISLFRVMLTDYCMFDCAYCPNSYWVPRERYGFKVDELARLFADAHRRHEVEGLFLSSGIFGSPDQTTQRLVDVVEVLRTRYDFTGYIHLKVMPGTSPAAVREALRWGTRLSVNLESPSRRHLERVSGMKEFDRDLLRPMRTIHDALLERYGTAVGQATQFVVGAAGETDRDIHHRQLQLYDAWGLKRIYYAPFRPVQFTPLEEQAPTPVIRTHRLNQLDWLVRVYGFERSEMDLAFGPGGDLNPDLDPKLAIAARQTGRYPLDVNQATHAELLRVPGIGPIAADRLVRLRQGHVIGHWRELQAVGVVIRRALPFLQFPGNRPGNAIQRRLPALQTLSADAPAQFAGTGALPANGKVGAGCATCPRSPATCGSHGAAA